MIVQGYVYDNPYDDRHMTVCKIVARADINEISDGGISPTFLIRFSDGFERTAIMECLHPWYPTD